MEFPPKI